MSNNSTTNQNPTIKRRKKEKHVQLLQETWTLGMRLQKKSSKLNIK
jgi:hypothetical protein